MLSRDELNKLNLAELKRLASIYGVVPLGGLGYPDTWRAVIESFPRQAIAEFRDGKGLHYGATRIGNELDSLIMKIGYPTESQMALIRASVKGERCGDAVDYYFQQRLLVLWHCRQHMIQALAAVSN